MSATLAVDSIFPEPGKLFAERYRVERLLGTGGQSRVYAAVQQGFDRTVAVKILHVDHPSNRSVRDTLEKRFYREARLLSRLRGPHTLRVYDYGRTETGQLFMVSELVPGTDLRELMRESGSLGERRARRIFTQILQGLMEVHSEGFLHRDIKPSNVMVFDHVGKRDRVKLLDFGIAKAITQFASDETALTRAGFVIGTPGAPHDRIEENERDRNRTEAAKVIRHRDGGRALKQFWLQLLVACVLASPLIASAEPSADEVERAEDAYRSGLEAFRQGEHDRAADLFRASYDIIGSPELLYNEAVARARSGDRPGARRVFAEAVKLDLDPVVDAKFRARHIGWAAADRATEVLEARPATQRESMATVVPGVGDESIGSTANDGKIDLSARQEPAPSSANSLRVVSYVAGGLGLASFGVAGVMELQLQQLRPTLNAARRSDAATYQATLRRGRTYQTVGRVSLIGGSVLVTSAVVLWILSRTSKTERSALLSF